MKTRLLLRAAIVTCAAASPMSGQTVRPESLSYMSRLFRMNDLGAVVNPRYSRDGRWLAFDARPNTGGGRHIFVVAANGGTPVAVTTGSQTDATPMWTAAGDRLVFSSSLTNGLMTIAIDPRTGHATGAAKRVTIDSVATPGGFDVAPDGRGVAYVTPTGPNKFELRVVPINGGPSKTLATVQGGAGVLRFDRTGERIYFTVARLDESPPRKGSRARDVKQIAASGGAASTVFTIPEGLMGVQIDPIADRVLIRDNERAFVLTLRGDSVATIAWARGFGTVGHLGFTPDGSSIVTALDASRASIHVVPLDGGPIRALTDSSGNPWPDYWIGDHIFISGDGRVSREDLLALDGTLTKIDPDLRKANDGVSLKVVSNDPFADGINQAVKAVDAGGDTSLFVFNLRTGEAKRVVQKLAGSRMVWAAGPGDDYAGQMGNGLLYGSVKSGILEVHLFDVSGADRLVHSVPLPKQREFLAFAPGRRAHGYQRGDTAFIDVTIGSGTVRVLARPGAKIGEMVFNTNGSSLFAQVFTGSGENARPGGAFFSTADARSLTTPARWVETGDCWHATWLPSGAGVLEFCQDAKGARTWVSRIPASGPATAQSVTQRETAIFWDYTLSPDGKDVAVPAESNSGVFLWRIDLRGSAKVQGGR